MVSICNGYSRPCAFTHFISRVRFQVNSRRQSSAHISLIGPVICFSCAPCATTNDSVNTCTEAFTFRNLQNTTITNRCENHRNHEHHRKLRNIFIEYASRSPPTPGFLRQASRRAGMKARKARHACMHAGSRAGNNQILRWLLGAILANCMLRAISIAENKKLDFTR